MKGGMGLIEVVLGAAIVLFVTTSLFSAYVTYFQTGLSNVRRIQGAFLLEEGVEAFRIMRDTSFSTYVFPLSTTTSYRLAFATSTALWQATTSTKFIDGNFDRTLQIADVTRDSGGTIVSSGGTYDPDTKKITISVSWNTSRGTTTKTVPTYLTNLFSN